MQNGQPDLNTLIALIEDRKKKQGALEQLAQQDPTQGRVFQKRGASQLLGLGGATPEQSRIMLQMLSSKPQGNETRTDAWSRGLLKGIDARNEALTAKHDRKIAAAQLGVGGADKNFSMGKDLYTAQAQQDQTAFDRGKVGTVDVAGQRYQTDAQGKIIGHLGAAAAPKAPEGFSLSEGQKRYDSEGRLIAQNKKTATADKDLAKLEEQQGPRLNNLRKAMRFLDAFTSGAESGTTRKLAKWIPGTYTDQGAFDAELDSFNLRGARQALSDAGEVRPTDPDVAQMRESLFGVGQDEAVNINLLKDFISEAIWQENKLRKAKGLPPLPEYEGRNVGDAWYQDLFGNTASGQKTNAPGEYSPSTPGKIIQW